MPIVNGKVIATSDINMAINEAVNGSTKILYLGDVASTPNIEGIITPTLLVPSYRALSLLVDGRERDYENMYLKDLFSPSAVESFASIMGLLYYSSNVVLLFPSENSDLNYSNILLTHLQRVYGITAQTKSTYFNYDPNFDPVNARLLYLYNIIPPTDYVMMTYSFNDVDVNKLRSDIGEAWHIPANVSNEEFVNILAKKKDQIMKYGRILEPIMEREVPKQ